MALLSAIGCSSKDEPGTPTPVPAATGGAPGAGTNPGTGGTSGGSGHDRGGVAGLAGNTSTGGVAPTGGAPTTGGSAGNGSATAGAGGSGGQNTAGATGIPVTPDASGLLPQEGNPINTELDNYKKYLPGTPEGDKLWGDIVVSWQFTTGAFPKSGFDHEYKQGIATEAMRAATQEGRRSLGTLDNDSTITELASLGHTYREFKDPSHQKAAQNALEYLLEAQRPTGGWQQWYPARGADHYSSQATFSDEAMMRVMIALQKAVRKQDPFNSDIFTEDQLKRSAAAIEKGVDYVLKSQIVVNGRRTVWCAQHDMQTYKPLGARTFELPSKSGQESVLIVAFLMSRPQTEEVAAAVRGGLDWYNDPKVYVADKMYVKPTSDDNKSPIVDAPGRKMWYRFYHIEEDRGFFSSNQTGEVFYDELILSNDEHRGAWWGGPWGEPLLAYATSLGML